MLNFRLFFAVLLGVIITTQSYTARDTMIINLRAQAKLTSLPTKAQVDTILAHLDTAGFFDNVKYTTNTSGLAIAHPTRLTQMARCFTDQKCAYFADSALKSAFYSSLFAWVKLNLNDANWYSRYIGYPLVMWQGVVLMDSVLYKERRSLRDSALNYLLWAWKSGLPAYKTGANLANIVNTSLPAAILKNDTNGVRAQRDSLNSSLAFAELDGIHADWSYSMHTGTGLQLYNGAYGSMFLGSVTQIGVFLSGTRFQMNPWAVDQIQNMLIEGCRWMSFGKLLDYNALGRGISRTNSSTQATAFGQSIQNLITLGASRADELAVYATEIAQNAKNDLSGNKLFWSHDFMVQRTPSWYASVRATSTRTVGNESGNGEGILDFHMADGVLMHFVDGEEYKGIFPIWNWNRIPGTSTVQNGRFPLINWGAGALGGSDFAGGASNGKYGMMSMVQNRDSVQLYKAWFMTPDGIVALGAGLNSNAKSPIYTSIEQNLLQGSAVLSGQKSLKFGDSTAFAKSIWHRNTAFYILDSTVKPRVQLKHQQGSWSKINQNYPDTLISDSVFQIGLDHGLAPKNGTYAYAIRPAVGAAYVDSAFAVQILKNTDSLQAILDRKSGMVGAVFYKAGKLLMPDGANFEVNGPCVVLYDPKGQIDLANPNRKMTTITVNIRPKNGKEQNLILPMPTGDGAGSSIFTSFENSGQIVGNLPSQIQGQIHQGQMNLLHPVASLRVFDVAGHLLRDYGPMSGEVDLGGFAQTNLWIELLNEGHRSYILWQP